MVATYAVQQRSSEIAHNLGAPLIREREDEAAMTWVRTEFGVGQETYELRTDNELVGVLRCRGSLVISGEAETDQGRWAFEPDGLLHRSVEISGAHKLGAPLCCDRTDVQAIYERHCTQSAVRGVLRFSDGRQLEWLKERTWGESWAFTTEQGEPVARFREGLGQGAIAELAGGATAEPELSLLLMLGFYLRRVGMEEDRIAAKREQRRRR